MNEITKQIDRLESEQSELRRDIRGINPKLSSYTIRLAKIEALGQQIARLREKRAATSSYDASAEAEMIPTTGMERRGGILKVVLKVA